MGEIVSIDCLFENSIEKNHEQQKLSFPYYLRTCLWLNLIMITIYYLMFEKSKHLPFPLCHLPCVILFFYLFLIISLTYVQKAVRKTSTITCTFLTFDCNCNNFFYSIHYTLIFLCRHENQQKSLRTFLHQEKVKNHFLVFFSFFFSFIRVNIDQRLFTPKEFTHLHTLTLNYCNNKKKRKILSGWKIKLWSLLSVK